MRQGLSMSVGHHQRMWASPGLRETHRPGSRRRAVKEVPFATIRVTPPRRRVPILLVFMAAVVLAPLPRGHAYPRPGLTTPASVTSEGLQAVYPPGTSFNHGSVWPDLSFDGRYVAFSSVATNLVLGDTNLAEDVFVHDRHSGQTQRVSISSQGLQGIGRCGLSTDPGQGLGGEAHRPSISANGRFIAFESNFCNLVIGDTNLARDVFVHDRKRGTTERVSVSSDGSELAADSLNPAISPNGRFVLFRYNGASGDCCALYLRDRKSDKTHVLVKGENQLTNPGSVTSNGRYVYFETSRQLVATDTNLVLDVYLLDRKKGDFELISVASDETPQRGGNPVFGGSRHRWWFPVGRTMSPNARYFAFSSDATNFVPNDANGTSRPGGWDTFVRDRKTGRTERVSVDSYGREASSGFSHPQAITSDGRFVVIWSYQSYDRGDTGDYFLGIEGDPDVFVYDRHTGTMERISLASDGTEARNCPQDVAGSGLTRVPGSASLSLPGSISQDGQVVAFASCADNLMANDNNLGTDVFLRDRGLALGVGGFGNGGQGQGGDPPDKICITPDICIPPLGVVSATDAVGDSDRAVGGDSHMTEGADLTAVSLAYRPQHQDLFVVQELQHMPSLGLGAQGVATARSSHLLYGLRFTASGNRYELRASSLHGGIFGLFDCTRGPACRKVADLTGGFGTTGERIVMSLPLDKLGLSGGGELRRVFAFSALGDYHAGALELLDLVALGRRKIERDANQTEVQQ